MRNQLSEVFTAAMRRDWIGLKHDGRKIVDVKVEIEESYYDDTSYSQSFDEIKVFFKTLSPNGRRHKWVRAYLY
jgi:hypothetical protein